MPSRIYNPFLSRTFSGTKIFLIAAVVLIASCKKESDLGSGIQPAGDVMDLQSQDSLTLKTYTVKEDSLRSDEPAIVQIGNIYDPVFGITKASLFTQFVIPNNLNNLSFPGGTLDSCALCLAYDYDFYGDTSTSSPQDFRVYQMTEGIEHDSIYYSNKISQCYPNFANRIYVGDTTVTLHPRKKITLGANTYQPQLRIPIQYNFAQQIFSGFYANTPAFLQFMKGLYVESVTTPAVPGQGALLRFNLLDTTTKLIFYYHTGTIVSTFSFVVNSSAAYYSHFEHDYTNADPNLVSQLGNPGVNASNEVYVSACSGVKTKIEFPYLNNLRNLGYSIAINKAELVIKTEDPSNVPSNFPINKQLYVTSIDTAGNQLLLPDMFENSVYFGGSANTTTGEYHINIARYFQELMAGIVPNNGLYLKEIDPDSQGRRVVLGSSNNPLTNNYRMYLHLVYTRIN